MRVFGPECTGNSHAVAGLGRRLVVAVRHARTHQRLLARAISKCGLELAAVGSFWA